MNRELVDLRFWYWSVGGDQTQFYSTASGGFVPPADATLQAWTAAGNTPGPISLSDLGGVLAGLRLRPVDATVLAAYQQALASSLDVVMLRIAFNHENRIRTLEARAQVTQQQFIAAVANLL